MKKRRLKKYKNHKISLCVYTYSRLYSLACETAYKIVNTKSKMPQELRERMLNLCLYCEKIAFVGYREWKSEK